MSTSADMIAVLKSELKAAGITYAQLAEQLDIAESSVKRMFGRDGDLPLSRVDAICRVLGMEFADVARLVAERQPLQHQLTLAQEQAVVADKRLLLVATCCLSHWTFEQMVSTYTLSHAECVHGLARLDRLGVIELRPNNRYRLRVAKGFRWLADGPVMRLFRTELAAEYFAGTFDGEGETLLLLHGQISAAQAASFSDRLARLGEDFARQHTADLKLPAGQRRPYSMVVAMRSWVLSAFRDMLRADATWPSGATPPPTGSSPISHHSS